MTTKKQELEVKKATELAENQLLDEYAGEGFENEDHDSGAIPRLKILQKSSPEVDEDSGDYIKGAKAGMVINTVTKRIYDTKKGCIVVVPCYYEKLFNEWIPIQEGGGFVDSYGAAEGNKLIEDLERDERGVPITEDGHEIRDTREHYFLVIDEGNYEPVVSSFTSTKIKKSKAWWTNMKMARLPGHPLKVPAMFAFSYEMRTVVETKDQYTYFNWDIKKAQPVLEIDPTGGIIQVAKAFKDAIVSGVKKAVPEQDVVAPTEDEEF